MAETIALLFCDLAGSTRLLARLGSDAYGQVLSDYRRLVDTAASAEGGQVVDHEGDGVFVVFPTAAGAIRAAVEAQRQLADDRLRDAGSVARMGIHAGEVERHEGGYVGLDVHRAARVGAAAHGGQVLVSEAARALAADALPTELELRELGEHHLDGFDRPERLHQVIAPGLEVDFPPLRTATRTPHNLPVQPTSFVGRALELDEVESLARRQRLVTLTGVGGSGKTRLALEVATRLFDAHPDGVWLVELAAVADPEAVPHEVAGVLSVREERGGGTRPITDRLVDHLAEREALLLLDNCEHVLGATADLSDRLLRSCPAVRLLATSREGLGVAGETIWQVPSLAVPSPDAPDEEVEGADAIRLFVARARAALPSFELEAETRPLAVRICRRLDGIPLAIELAAARIRVLGLGGLADRLDDRFRVLTGGSRTALPRQQTLGATIDWSFQLLEDEERALFLRLAVFAGPFALETVEAVCGGDDIAEADVLDLLARLVDRSLIDTVEVGGGGAPPRYRLLETLRAYARDRLTADPALAEAVRRRHRDHHLAVAEVALAQLRGAEEAVALAGLDEVREDLRAALEWSVERGHGDDAAVIAVALAALWIDEGHVQRVVSELYPVLDLGVGDPAREADLRCHLVRPLGTLGRADDGLAQAERARALVADLPPSATKVHTLVEYAGALLGHVGRAGEDAIPPSREAVAVARALDDEAVLAAALSHLGHVLAWNGDVGGAIDALREGLGMARRLGHPRAVTRAYSSLLFTLLGGRRHDEAREMADEALRWLDDPDHEDSVRAAYVLMWSAYILLRAGEWDRADATIARIETRHLEGMDIGIVHHLRGTLGWFRGELGEAAAHATALRDLGIARWQHDGWPLLAEVAVLDGRFDDVRAVADEYLLAPVDAGEEMMKTAVLRPLVHAEVDAALETTGPEREEHLERAREVVGMIRDRIESYPEPPPLQYEPPATNLVLAEAELSRAVGPDPALWERARDASHLVYWELYTTFRRGEALLATDQRDAAREELSEAHRRAAVLGAAAVRREVERVATAAGFELTSSTPAAMTGRTEHERRGHGGHGGLCGRRTPGLGR